MEGKKFEIKHVQKIIESKDAQALEECIASLEINAVSIGEGGNAVVYVAEGTPFEKVCLKKIKEKQQIIYNDVDQESIYQMKVREAGVNTPFSLLSLKTEGGHFIVMERINGNSVKDILKDDKLMPPNFNYKIFCDSLDLQISKMHKAGIYHRDLHEGNVMVEIQEGEGVPPLPVIIDFGSATEGTGSDFTYEESVMSYNEKTGHYDLVNGYFKDDLIMARNIKSSLKSFM